MIPGYDYSRTLLETRSLLSQRLNDTGMVFWSSSELDFYLREALSTWNCFSRYYKCRGTITLNASQRTVSVVNLTANTSDTDLTQIAPISISISARKILTGILFHLLEITSDSLPIVSDLTGHISSTLLQESIITSLNRVVQESSAYISTSQISPVVAGSERISISSTIINILRAEWETLEGTITPLTRSSKFSQQHWLTPQQATQRFPENYSLETSPLLKLDLNPIPADNGKLNLFTVNSQSLSVDLFTENQLFFFLADWWWLVKYAALSKILSTDGPTLYPQMAQYYEQRTKQGIEMLKQWTYFESLTVNGLPLEIASTASADYWSQGWKNSTSTSGVPRSVNLLGANLGYLDRTNITDSLSLTVDSLRDAPQPTEDDDLFPIAPEHLNYLLDYAQHLASHKMGGSEFSSTMQLMESFLNGAQRVNDKLQANIEQLLPIAQVRLREQRRQEEPDLALTSQKGA